MTNHLVLFHRREGNAETEPVKFAGYFAEQSRGRELALVTVSPYLSLYLIALAALIPGQPIKSPYSRIKSEL